MRRAGYAIGDEASFHCSRLLNPLGNRAAAELAYRELLAAWPEHVDGLEGMAFLLQLQGRSAEAAPYRERLLRQRVRAVGVDELHQDEATAYLLAGEGREAQPRQAPQAYIRSLFDGYANNFDAHLLQQLHYQVPEQLYNSLDGILDLEAISLDILDLGCGTGLAGRVFRKLAKRLDGLDLSAAMLLKAANRGIYDRLEQGEITERLSHMEQRYDLVIAADVMVYIGDLKPVLRAVYRVLRGGGYSVFSVEAGKAAGYRLRSTGRYQHHSSYVAEVAQSAGLETLCCRQVVLREQEGQPVRGSVFVLQRPDE
ncbi:MAG: methyltransferase domain-containing protein [Chromatiales bacterium]